MGISNPRDDRTVPRFRSARSSLGLKMPIYNRTPYWIHFLAQYHRKITFHFIWSSSRNWIELKHICVVCLGKNTRVRTEFLSQAKTQDFLIWCARASVPTGNKSGDNNRFVYEPTHWAAKCHNKILWQLLSSVFTIYFSTHSYQNIIRLLLHLFLLLHFGCPQTVSRHSLKLLCTVQLVYKQIFLGNCHNTQHYSNSEKSASL